MECESLVTKHGLRGDFVLTEMRYHMKLQLMTYALLLGIILGGAAGYALAMQKVMLSRQDYVRFLHSITEERAKAYFVAVNTLETNAIGLPADLRRRAYPCLSNYVKEVQMYANDTEFRYIPIDNAFYHRVLGLLSNTNARSLKQ